MKLKIYGFNNNKSIKNNGKLGTYKVFIGPHQQLC